MASLQTSMRAVSAVIEQEDADLARAIQLSLHDAQLPTSSTHHTPQPGSRLHDFQQALAGVRDPTMTFPNAHAPLLLGAATMAAPPTNYPSTNGSVPNPHHSDATAADEQYARLLQEQFDREAAQGLSATHGLSGSSARFAGPMGPPVAPPMPFNPNNPQGPYLQPRRVKSPEKHQRNRNSPPGRAVSAVPNPAVVDARSNSQNPVVVDHATPTSTGWWGSPQEKRNNAVLGATAVTVGNGLPVVSASSSNLDAMAVSRGEMCAGCHKYFGFMDGLRRVAAMGCNWHADCFACGHCGAAFRGHATFVVGDDGKPYHRACHTTKFVPKCTICHQHIAADAEGRIKWNEHPFWKEKYCPQHNNERRPRCNSCQRLQPDGQSWPNLTDGRSLCLVCLGTIVANTAEAQPLYRDVLSFYATTGLPLPSIPPLMLVDGSALNEQGARHGRSADASDGPVFHTRGLCLSEERTIYRTSIPNGLLGALCGATPTTTPVGNPETSVTAILLLAGLPRLLTGSILAHEVMHAFFRLAGYRDLPADVEEGTCQLMALLWLEHQTPVEGSQEARLASFFAHEIRSDLSVVYGEGFRAAYDAFSRVGLYALLQYIRTHNAFP